MTDKKDIYGEKWYVGVLNNRYINRMSDSSPVCEVYGDDEGWDRANLMAAAPEMLALLEDIRVESDYVRGARDGDNQDGPGLPGVLHARLDHVIGKARGLVNTSSVPLPGREEADND